VTPVSSFRPDVVLETLNRHGVRYVLIGGVAATLHGSPLRTGDTDICPARDPPNLESLAVSLRELRARIRTEGIDGGLPFACDAKFLASVALLNLETQAGDVDIAFLPSGTLGYDDLAQRLERFDLGGVIAPTASLADVIRSKTAADRPKDRDALPLLRELARQSMARRTGGSGGSEGPA
jgi:hypothetical protein